MYGAKYDIESLLFSYYIKYDRLLELNRMVEPVSGMDTVNIYIDLYDLLKRLYKQEITARNKFSVTSSIINLAAHYRGYYKTRHRLWARIFLVYADESNNNHRLFVPTYNFNKNEEIINYEKTNNLIRSQLELVKILAAYIDDVYYIEKTSDFSMFVYDNIMNNPETKDEVSILITRSSYVYQVPAFCKSTYLFRPKKTKDGDQSFCVKFNNSLVQYCSRVHSAELLRRLSLINPQLMSVVMTLNGCPDKYVNSLCNISKVSSILLDAIINHRIIDGYNSDTGFLYNNLAGIQAIVDPVTFDARFKALDLIYQHTIYANMVESKDFTWIINLNDPNTVRDINNHYFIDNPLDLNNL